MKVLTFCSDSNVVQLELKPLFLLCATLCASDAVAALGMIKYKDTPKLFSVIFGEGLVNDAVSIILVQAVDSLFE